MVNKLLRIIAPHHCYGCQQIGAVLCDNCKYDIAEDGFSGCVVCARPSVVGICGTCHTTYDRAWSVGDRSGVLARTVDAYKFERVSDAADALASLLDERLPVLPHNVVVVPIPTISRHVRQRGYDHTLLIASHLAKLRSLPCKPLLTRNEGSMVQLGKSKIDRMRQAERAFRCDAVLDPDLIYLIVDDVITTNATVRYASHVLGSAGAKDVWVAVVARQPLDKRA